MCQGIIGMNKKIIFASGGTGGHIFPAVTMMNHLSQNGYEVILVTDKRGHGFLKKYPKLKSYVIAASSPTDKKFINKVVSLFLIIISLFKSATIIYKIKPNLIFGFGGYASFSVSILSKLFNIPLIIYDNNLVLGRANKVLASISKKILLANKMSKNFPDQHNKKIHEVGFILRKEIANYNNKIKQKNGRNIFSILVLGGSQGAKIFGEVIPPVIKRINDLGHKIEIKQQCREEQKESIVNFYKNNKIVNEVFNFSDDIFKIMSSADLAISRCGASSIAELVHFCTPFIAVPLENSIDDHQLLNAKFFEEKKYCWILKEENFNSDNLYNCIIKIIENKKILENIHEKMKKNDSNNAHIKVENIIKDFI